MSSNVKLRDPVLDNVRAETHMASAVSWGSLALGMTWVIYGMFVLSYRVGSLAAVAALAGVAFLFGGVSQLVVARQADEWRSLFVLSGVLAVAAGIVAFAWPGVTLYVISVLVAWYLVAFGVIHLIGALAGPKAALWWTQLLFGTTELVLGVWAVRSWEHSLVTLVTLVGSWAVFYGVSQIFAAFSLRQAAKRTERLVG
ncbi:MAG TPA: DUF308 domain-containing protein [Kineosporiaceae bacterium]|nr:DUF308 domain-containing protein [Kineosporiaceae bacterium]